MLQGIKCLLVRLIPDPEFGLCPGGGLSCESVQWGRYVGKAFDEAAVVIGSAQEAAQLGAALCGRACGDRPVAHSLQLGRIHGNAVAGHEVSQEHELLFHEMALAEFGFEAELAQLVKHQAHMAPVLLSSAREDADVIQIHHHKLVEVGAQHMLHQALEGGRRVLESKGHHAPLIQPKGRAPGSLVLVALPHGHLPEAILQVYGGEELGAHHSVHAGVSVGHGVGIALCAGIELAVVDSTAQSAIFLANKHSLCSMRCRAGHQPTFGQQLIQGALEFLQLWQAVLAQASSAGPFVRGPCDLVPNGQGRVHTGGHRPKHIGVL